MLVNKRAKATIAILCGTLVLVTIALLLGLKIWRERTATLHTRKTLVVVVETKQRDAFFDMLTQFAEIHELDIHIGQTTPEGGTFNVNMSRKDVMIIANNVFDQNIYDIDFYDKNPARPASDQVIDDLVNDLKKFLSEVPDIEISGP